MKINLGNCWEKTCVPCYKLSVACISVIKMISEYIFLSGNQIYSVLLGDTNVSNDVLLMFSILLYS